MYTYNSDPDYYSKYSYKTNCGSYALCLKEWFDPYCAFFNITGLTIEDWVEEQWKKGLSDIVVSCLYRDILVDYLLKEFEGELKLCDGRRTSETNVELIAFSTFCTQDAFGFSDYDFHFKVFRDGMWSEKCGDTSVRICEEWDWDYDDFEYIAEPVYFYHKITDLINVEENVVG